MNLSASNQCQHAHPHIAQIVCALGQQFIAQRGQPVRMRRHSLLPSECRALPFCHGRLGDLQKIGIAEQFLVRGENRRLCRIGLGMQARPQRRELGLPSGNRILETMTFDIHSRAGLVHFNLHAAHLENLANGEPRRSGHTNQQVGIT